MISDLDLIRSAHPSTESSMRAAVVYLNGTKIHFAVESRKQARIIAREYGMRFLAGARVYSLDIMEETS